MHGVVSCLLIVGEKDYEIRLMMKQCWGEYLVGSKFSPSFLMVGGRPEVRYPYNPCLFFSIKKYWERGENIVGEICLGKEKYP